MTNTLSKVAGHVFDNYSLDAVCINVKMDGTRCKMCRSSLFLTTEADVDNHGFACVGGLLRSEYHEIEVERKQFTDRADRLMAAIRDVCAA